MRSPLSSRARHARTHHRSDGPSTLEGPKSVEPRARPCSSQPAADHHRKRTPLVADVPSAKGLAALGRTAIAVERAGPAEHIALIVAAYGLTPRERDVMTLVLRGRSTADISRSAGVSLHTVQDHLKSVFDKTGVRSRRDLVATLFARHYLPDMSPPAFAPQRRPRD
ncbi:response regulator transcription factor [Streptomyces variabilis]|uniref:response regulator transcription factor n=1 Tax=Streptomyces variabilis TaxID=67372 RepID=UPI0024846AAF|nr:helix-turn-helix transcriptional regulator [Streptomyces variabilis]